MSLEPYVFPPSPSHQVKVVQEYLKYYSEFDFDRLSGLSTDNFTQLTLPASLGLSVRTKIEELGFLKDLQASVGGKTLQLTVYSVDDGVGKTWIHLKIDTLDLEAIYLFQFGEGANAHKLTSIREFLDSKKYSELTAPAST